MNVNTANAFLREFEAFMDCYTQTVEAIPDDDWAKGDAARSTPVHQACHCLVPIVSYTRADTDIQDITFRFKKPASYPSKDRVLEVASVSRQALPEYIQGIVTRNSTERELAVPPLFKLIYLLRHSIVHLSYLRDELARRGVRLPEYSRAYRPKSCQ